jgi:hypothetical protein
VCVKSGSQKLSEITPNEVTIRVLSGPGKGDVHVVTEFPAVVGRSQTCDVILRDDPDLPTISRQHLRLAVDGVSLMIEDLSSNGTRVGNRPMVKGEVTIVEPDVVVWLGPATTIALDVEGPSVAPAPAPPGELELRVLSLGAVEALVEKIALPTSVWGSSQAFCTLVILIDQAYRSQPGLDGDTLAKALGIARDRLSTVLDQLVSAFDSWPGTFKLPRPFVVQEGRMILEPRFRVAYDVFQIEKLCASSESKSPQGWMTLLEQVTLLWRGPFLAGFKEPWARQRRKSIEARLQEPIQKLSQIALEPHMRAKLVSIYQQLLNQDPCHLAAHLALSRELARQERFDLVEAQIAHYQEALLKHEGIKPGPALMKIWNELLDSRDRPPE